MSEQKTTKRVSYKGIMVPARELEIGEGKVKLVPSKTDRYTLYGIPMPNKLELTNELKDIATNIITLNKDGVNKREPVLIRYVRKGRDGYVLGSNATDKDTIEYFVTKGEPYGVVVAFLYEGNLRIGWSKRLEGFKKQMKSELDNFNAEEIQTGKMVPREPLSFTKKDAVNIAVIRGLVDSLTSRGSGIFTIGNDVIPKSIAKVLPSFVEKAEKYFRCNAINVYKHTPVDQVDVEKECPSFDEDV